MRKLFQIIDVRARLLIAIAVLVPLASQYLVDTVSNDLHKMELLAYDWHSRSLPREAPDPRIALVGMDSESIDHMGDVLSDQTYPVPPRMVLTRVVDNLRLAGAKVVGFDEMFTADFSKRTTPGQPSVDEVFSAALRRQGGIVAAVHPHTVVVGDHEETNFTESAPMLRPYILESSILASRFFDRVRWFDPYPVDVQTGNRYPDISMSLVAKYRNDAGTDPLLRGGKFRWGTIAAPVAQNGGVLIRYAGPAGTFPPMPYYKIYKNLWQAEYGPNYFLGKIVLIGIVDELQDRQDTPFGEMQGVEILTNRLQTVLRGEWIREWGSLNEYVWSVVMGLVLTFAVWKLELRWAMGTWIFLMALAVATSHFMFVEDLIWAPTVSPVLGLTCTYILSTFVEERRIRKVFHRFLPSQVADQWLRESDNAASRSEVVNATIAFCDVRNYTKMSETLPIETIDQLLQAYFNAGEELAFRYGTELDKFVGDEIMLYFIERPRDDKRGGGTHAVRAVRWALDMQEEMDRISASGLAGEIGFRIGIGLCSGSVRFGTVGARKRIQHTVIGDAVNTASRLQGVSKEVGQRIVMGESTYLLVKDRFEAEQVGEVSVKGKAEPLPIYSPTEVKSDERKAMSGGSQRKVM